MSFELKDSLIAYYKVYPEPEILKHIKVLERKSDEYKKALYSELVNKNARNFGFPDLTAFFKAENSGDVKNAVSCENNKRTFWAVCDRCKSYYDYQLFCCPVCYANGHHIMSRSVKVSETGIIPDKIVRLNLTSPSVTIIPGQNCFSCSERENSYCYHFGKPDYNCQQGDFEYCRCKKCCIAAKKKKQEEEKRLRELSLKDMPDQF